MSFMSGLEDFGNWIGDTFFGGSHQTNATNQAIAYQNLAFQKEANEQNIAFQQRENQITREREDNAVQRAAADMTAAGLSKTLAAGQPASAQALSAPQTQALNNSYKMERNMAGLNMANMVQDIVFKAKEAKRQRDIADAQIDNIEADTAGKNLSNSVFMQQWTNEQALKVAQTEQTQALTSLYKVQTELEQRLGPYKIEEIQKNIAKLIADESYIKAQTNTETWKQLNYRSGIQLNDSQMTLLAHQVSKTACETLKIKNETEQNMVADYVYKMLQANALTHDINFAERYNYPVGFYPSSLFGTIGHTGKQLEEINQNVYKWGKNQFADTMNLVKNGFKGLFNFYDKETDAVQNAGGGLLDALRSVFNFNLLTKLFNR